MNDIMASEKKSLASAHSLPERAEQDSRYQWDTSFLYKDEAAWQNDFDKIDTQVQTLEKMRGTLNSANKVAEFLESETSLERIIDRLHVYAYLLSDEDTSDSTKQARLSRIRSLATSASERLAWFLPEMLSHTAEELSAWLDAPELKTNRYALIKIMRLKPHTLTATEETLLSGAEEIFSSASHSYSLLINADIRFPDIIDDKGIRQELSHSRYLLLLRSTDRKVRSDAYKGMYQTVSKYKNTFASLLSTQVKRNNYLSRVRNYPSALAHALHDDNIPVSLYDTLITATHHAIPFFHEYLAVRKHALKLEKLCMYDLHVSFTPSCDLRIPFEQAFEWILEACAPLGADYTSVLSSAYTERWMDVYENKGKKSGAYASGCYDSHPYVLLNYHDTIDDVFTLAHELGHAMHSWQSNRHQSPRYARYPIFLAEIASTVNEALLIDYLLKKFSDNSLQLFLLNHLCDMFKSTLYRQTMLAEFEKHIHELDAAGTPLTQDTLGVSYQKLNHLYYGHNVHLDEYIAGEWVRIPHFYYNFYVYKYATSFCASQIFAKRIQGNPEHRDAYLELLRSGGSDDPLEIVQRAGVDLTKYQTLENAFLTFHETVSQLSAKLNS